MIKISHTVDCGNGHFFCWECRSVQGHAPVACTLWEKWLEKCAKMDNMGAGKQSVLRLWFKGPYSGFNLWINKYSDYIFALIASILLNELFIMNLSFKERVLSLYRSIRIEVRHQNVLSVWSQLLRFWTKFKGFRICK